MQQENVLIGISNALRLDGIIERNDLVQFDIFG